MRLITGCYHFSSRLITTIVLWIPLAGNAQDKHALVQKLFDVSDVSNQIKEERSSNGSRKKSKCQVLPDDTFNYIQSKVQAELSTEMTTFMGKWTYPLVENDYSNEELRCIIEFYSSETGKTLGHKIPTVTQQMLSHLPECLR